MLVLVFANGFHSGNCYKFSREGGVKTMKGLTEKQRRVLEFIESFEETNGMAPTVYEIAENFSVKNFSGLFPFACTSAEEISFQKFQSPQYYADKTDPSQTEAKRLALYSFDGSSFHRPEIGSSERNFLRCFFSEPGVKCL